MISGSTPKSSIKNFHSVQVFLRYSKMRSSRSACLIWNLLFGLRRFTLYSCIHPRIHLFENTIFFSSGTSFSSCDSHCSWNVLHCALNIDFGSLAFKLDRMSMTQSYIAARTSSTDFFLPPPVWRNFTFAGGSVKSLTSKLSRHHFPSLREFDKSGSLCFISFKSE